MRYSEHEGMTILGDRGPFVDHRALGDAQAQPLYEFGGIADTSPQVVQGVLINVASMGIGDSFGDAITIPTPSGEITPDQVPGPVILASPSLGQSIPANQSTDELSMGGSSVIQNQDNQNPNPPTIQGVSVTDSAIVPPDAVKTTSN